MIIGDQRLLHNVAFPQNSRKGDAPDRFVLVTVIDSKSVPNTWGPGTDRGFRALGEDNRIYTCCWSSFPDDSTTPYWVWERELHGENEIKRAVKDNDALWYDVTLGNMAYISFRPVWLDIYRYQEVVEHCARHQLLYYIQDGCFHCQRMPEVLPPPDYSWLGWK